MRINENDKSTLSALVKLNETDAFIFYPLTRCKKEETSFVNGTQRV